MPTTKGNSKDIVLLFNIICTPCPQTPGNGLLPASSHLEHGRWVCVHMNPDLHKQWGTVCAHAPFAQAACADGAVYTHACQKLTQNHHLLPVCKAEKVGKFWSNMYSFNTIPVQTIRDLHDWSEWGRSKPGDLVKGSLMASHKKVTWTIPFARHCQNYTG